LQEYAHRPSDICARYGGEEFALVWGSTQLDDAKLLVRALMSKIEGLQIPNKRSEVNQYLTVSIGLAKIVPHSKSTIIELISRADDLLYKAKRSGRNRVEYSSD
jgi:diguanylate cyclase (GGDEF)-like protein